MIPGVRLCRTLTMVGLLGAVLLTAGCGSGVDKSGPAVAPQNMDPAKQQQYSDFMKNQKPGSPGGAPGMPGSPPGPGGRPPGSGPAPPHG